MTTINAIGRITKDFELSTSDSGVEYAHFSLAINKGHGKNRKTYFYKCTVYEAVARKLIKAQAKAGSHICVTGGFGTSEFRRNNGEMGYDFDFVFRVTAILILVRSDNVWN